MARFLTWLGGTASVPRFALCCLIASALGSMVLATAQVGIVLVVPLLLAVLMGALVQKMLL